MDSRRMHICKISQKVGRSFETCKKKCGVIVNKEHRPFRYKCQVPNHFSNVHGETKMRLKL